MTIETSKLPVFLCLGASLVLGSARAAENVVLESNTARYTVGQTLDADVALTLSEGQVVVVTTEDGRVLVVRGPHEGPATGQPPTESRLRRLLAQLFGVERPEVEGLGGVRGNPEEDQRLADARPDAWLINAGRTSDQCVVRGEPVHFWREEAQGPAHSTIVDLASGESADLQWGAPSGAGWPFAAPPGDDRIYLVRPADDLRSTAIRLHTLPAGVAGKGLATVAWLAARGCVAQARILLRTVSAGPAP